MKKICLFFLLLGLIAFLMQDVAAATLAISPGMLSVPYTPGTTYELTVTVQYAPGHRLLLTKTGEMADFLELPVERIDISSRGLELVTVRFTVPQTERPGYHSAELIVQEDPGETLFGLPAGNVRAYAAVSAPIKFFVPYPDKYAEVSLQASDAERGKPVFFSANIKNLGSKDILAIGGQVEIRDPENIMVAVVPLTTAQNIAPGASVTLRSEWQTDGATLGDYAATAIVNYDEYSTTAEDKFKIGDLFIEIVRLSTTRLYRSEIVPIAVVIQSKWNRAIDNIYATLEIADYETLTKAETPTLSRLDAWGSNTLSAFLDTGGIVEGNYTLKVKVFYEGKTSGKDFPIVIETRPSEQPKKFVLDQNIIAIVLLIIMIIVLLYLYERKKKHGYGY